MKTILLIPAIMLFWPGVASKGAEGGYYQASEEEVKQQIADMFHKVEAYEASRPVYVSLFRYRAERIKRLEEIALKPRH